MPRRVMTIRALPTAATAGGGGAGGAPPADLAAAFHLPAAQRRGLVLGAPSRRRPRRRRCRPASAVDVADADATTARPARSWIPRCWGCSHGWSAADAAQLAVFGLGPQAIRLLTPDSSMTGCDEAEAAAIASGVKAADAAAALATKQASSMVPLLPQGR